MAIKPPAWCRRAVPVPHGWKHWATSEILLPKTFTQEQIDEFWAEKEGASAPAAPAPEPVATDEDVQDMITEGKIQAAMADSELDAMSKKELENLGREHGVELDRRQSKKSLVTQMKGIITSK
jgi:uncharacterized membrane protein YebE (DUF533 family)